MSQDAFAPAFTVGAVLGAIDPAIDVKATGAAKLDEYRAKRDPHLLRFVPGATPVWYELRPVPAPYYFEVLCNPTLHPALRNMVAFRAACTAVHLSASEVWRPDEGAMIETTFDGFKIAGDEWIERVAARFGAVRVREIGGVIYERASVGEAAMGPFVRVSPSPAGTAPAG